MASSKNRSGSKKSGSKKAAGAAKLAAAKKTVAGEAPAGGAKISRKASPAPPVSFAAQIAPMFRTMDVQCMRSRGVFLKNYNYMKDPDNANMVLSMLQPDADPRMPFGGPYWTDENIALFQKWINDGLKP
jgi:hypothetical protein